MQRGETVITHGLGKTRQSGEENAKGNQKQVRGTYSNRAKQWGIPENMVLDDDPLLVDAPKGPKIGDPVIDKKTGATVYVTGVRPDGGLIVSPVKPE